MRRLRRREQPVFCSRKAARRAKTVPDGPRLLVESCRRRAGRRGCGIDRRAMTGRCHDEGGLRGPGDGPRRDAAGLRRPDDRIGEGASTASPHLAGGHGRPGAGRHGGGDDGADAQKGRGTASPSRSRGTAPSARSWWMRIPGDTLGVRGQPGGGSP